MANGRPGAGAATGEQLYIVLRSHRRCVLTKQLLVLKVKGDNGRHSFFGYAKTISRDGMFIATVSPKGIGEECAISFPLPGAGVEVRCHCAVIWRREFDPLLKSEPGMGVKFIDLDEEARDRIDEWVRTAASKPIRRF